MKLTCTMKQEFKLEPPYGDKTVYFYTLVRTNNGMLNGVTTIQYHSDDTNLFEIGKEYEIKVEVA